MTVLPPEIAASFAAAHRADLMQYAERRRAMPRRRSATWSFLRGHVLRPWSRLGAPRTAPTTEYTTELDALPEPELVSVPVVAAVSRRDTSGPRGSSPAEAA